MRRQTSFWRNAAIVGALHLAVVVGLVKLSARPAKPLATSVLWIEDTANLPGTVASAVAAEAPEPTPEEKEDAPAETSLTPAAETALPLPTATPAPSPTAPPKPTPSAKTSPTPRAKRVEKKREPKPARSKPAKKTVAKKSAPPRAQKKSGAAKKSGTTGTAGGRRAAAGDQQFAWYGNMLHDRFFSAWEQPQSVVVTGAKMSVLVRLRIESDGRVAKFELVRPSGNVVVDDSVAAVAKRVTRVDPLPAGLSAPYEVQISFELNPH